MTGDPAIAVAEANYVFVLHAVDALYLRLRHAAKFRDSGYVGVTRDPQYATQVATRTSKGKGNVLGLYEIASIVQAHDVNAAFDPENNPHLEVPKYDNTIGESVVERGIAPTTSPAPTHGRARRGAASRLREELRQGDGIDVRQAAGLLARDHPHDNVSCTPYSGLFVAGRNRHFPAKEKRK